MDRRRALGARSLMPSILFRFVSFPVQGISYIAADCNRLPLTILLISRLGALQVFSLLPTNTCEPAVDDISNMPYKNPEIAAMMRAAVP